MHDPRMIDDIELRVMKKHLELALESMDSALQAIFEAWDTGQLENRVWAPVERSLNDAHAFADVARRALADHFDETTRLETEVKGAVASIRRALESERSTEPST